MCIYDESWQTNYVFCCEIDEASSRELAREFAISYIFEIFSF